MQKTTVALGLLAALMAALPAAAQDGGRPSLRVGSAFRADLRVNLQADWRDVATTETPRPDAFELHRARIGVDGTFLRVFEYQVERELSGDRSAWRDVYVNVRLRRAL